MMKHIFFTITLLILTGCATPPGQFTESDFVWESREVAIDMQSVYSNIRAAYRNCGGDRGVPDGDIDPRKTTAKVDIYMTGIYGGRGDIVIGVVDIVTTSKSTSTIKVGIRPNFDSPVFGNKGEIRKFWMDAAAGQLKSCA